MKKYVYFAVLAAFVPLTVHLLRETRRLRDQVQNVEEERRRTAVAAIAAGWVGISEDEQEKNDRHLPRYRTGIHQSRHNGDAETYGACPRQACKAKVCDDAQKGDEACVQLRQHTFDQVRLHALLAFGISGAGNQQCDNRDKGAIKRKREVQDAQERPYGRG